MVREAATLNLMFLSDLAGLDPLPPLCALVTSFEACADDCHPPAVGPAEPAGLPASGLPVLSSRATASAVERQRLRTQDLMATLHTEVCSRAGRAAGKGCWEQAAEDAPDILQVLPSNSTVHWL